VTGLRLEDVPSPLARSLAALRPGATEVVALSGPRRVRCHRGTFMDRGFARGFLVIDEMTEEARTIERAAYEKLIRVMSHEVNNSVTASNSLLQSSLTYSRELAPGSRADFERAIAIVIERTEQLRQFMRRFANVFRLPPPRRETYRLDALVEPLVRLARERPDAAGVTWSWHPGSQVLHVSVDRGQFEQACLNVLINALQAAGPGGTVSVRLETEQGRPALLVEDSGSGLAAEARENVFTPFFSTKATGQGIGLTLVGEILAAHGCEFGIDSQPGGPTTFKILL
jgi:signal transduction histidine kinase